MRMLQLRVLFTLLILAGTSLAATNRPPLLDRDAVIAAARGVNPAAYPNADDVWVDELIHTRYAADGTYEIWDDEYIKILTEKGKRTRKVVSRHFTLPYGTDTIVTLEVIKPNGNVIPVDIAANQRIMTDTSQMQSNIYNPNHKILRVNVPDLELGDLLHITSHEVIVKPRVPGTFSDWKVFEYTSPIKSVTYEVVGPAALPLRNILLRDPVADTVTYTTQNEGDRVRHTWRVRDVPRMFREPGMPPLHTVVQRLLVSTIPDWETISTWYWDLSKPHLDAGTPEMTNTVQELTRGLTDNAAKTRALFQFVSQQVRYMGITTETEAPGYEPHDVSTTFGNRYGVCRDKAALLVAMLRIAGVPAYPVLIHVGPRKDAEVPQPFFNHAIVAVADGDDYLLMDPTDENTTELLPAYLNYKSYLVAHPDGEDLRTSPVVPAMDNLLDISSRGRLHTDGTLTMRSTLAFTGINDNAYRGHFARLKPDERRRFFEARLKRVLAGARLDTFRMTPDDIQDTSTPLTVHLGYQVVGYPVSGETHSLLSAPWLGRAFGYVNFILGSTGLASRRYPLMTRVTAATREDITLELDDGFGTPVAVPEPASWVQHDVRYEQTLGVSATQLQARALFAIDTVELPPDEYAGLKQLLRDRERELKRQAVMSRGDAPPEMHDVVVVSNITTVVFENASRWTVTEDVTKHILSYAGKKAHSELKLTYNEAWETVRLLDATVTQADGTVRQVVPEEMNVMDAPWVGAAPRYAPERTLVVSLPGVEVGSRIRYRIERRVDGKPFFSAIKVFQGMDPIAYASLTLDTPRKVKLEIRNRAPQARVEDTTRDGRRIQRWIVRDQDALTPEDDLPPPWSIAPSVMISGGDWEDYAKDVIAALKTAARQGDRAAAEGAQLAAGMPDQLENLRAIRDAVARRVRLAGPGLNALPLDAITPADTTLAEGYGNSADRAVVLAAMLKGAGLHPVFVLTSSKGPHLDLLSGALADAPQRELFDRVLVGLVIKDRTVLLNDTDQYAWPGVSAHDGKPLLMPSGRLSEVNVPNGHKDREQVAYRLDLDAEGNTLLTSHTRFYGMDFGRENKRYAELPPEERRRHFEELTAELSQRAVPVDELFTDFDDYPGIRAFTVNIPNYALRSGSYLYVTLPEGLGNLLKLQADTRQKAWYFEKPLRRVVEYEINLPPETRAVHCLPTTINWTGPGGLGTVCVTSTRTGNRIVVRQEADLKSAVVSASDYAELLRFQRELNHPAGRTILVEL